MATTRRTGTVVAIVLAAVMASGCGGPSRDDPAGPPPATTSTSPPPVHTAEQLAAALPGTDDVPGATEATTGCPGDDSCPDGNVSVTLQLERPVDAAEQERLAASAFTGDSVFVSVTAHPDDAAAEAAMGAAEKQAEAYEGAFDIAAKRTSDTSYTPAEKGTGTSRPIELAGWKGLDIAREQTYASPEGEGADDPFQVAQLVLVRGATQLVVSVIELDGPREDGAASTLARRVATDYLARLG